MAKKYIKTHSIQFVDVFYSRKQERGQCGVCLVRHHNTANPHCHLVYNRVDNNGKTISDKMERRRSEKVVKQLKDKYGLTYSDGKGQTRTERLHYTERTKFEVKNAVNAALKDSKDWRDFIRKLQQKGVEVEFKRRRGKDDVIDGITFIKDGVRFKGSQIGRQFSYAKLNERLANDEQRQTVNHTPTIRDEQPGQEPVQEMHHNREPSFDFSLGLFDTNNPVNDPAEEEFRRRMQRKKKEARTEIINSNE